MYLGAGSYVRRALCSNVGRASKSQLVLSLGPASRWGPRGWGSQCRLNSAVPRVHTEQQQRASRQRPGPLSTHHMGGGSGLSISLMFSATGDLRENQGQPPCLIQNTRVHFSLICDFSPEQRWSVLEKSRYTFFSQSTHASERTRRQGPLPRGWELGDKQGVPLLDEGWHLVGPHPQLVGVTGSGGGRKGGTAAVVGPASLLGVFPSCYHYVVYLIFRFY